MKGNKLKKISVLVLLAAWTVLAGASPAPEKNKKDQKKFTEYKSQHKKRGDVHGTSFDLPQAMVYEGIIQAFANLELTVNKEYRALGYLEGGHSRGISAERVITWVDPEGPRRWRVEVRNIRASRMGLIGALTTKDWSHELLAEIENVLADKPTLEQLQARVAEKPDSIDLRRQLAEMEVQFDMDDEAVAEYQALLQRHPDSLRDRLSCAELLLQHDRLAEAETLFAAAEMKDPATVLRLSRVCLQRENTDHALNLLNPLAESHPQDMRIRFELGRACFFSGDLERAKSLFGGIVTEAPQHAFAQYAGHWQKIIAAVESAGLDAPGTQRLIGEELHEEALNSLARKHLTAAWNGLPTGAEKYKSGCLVTEICVDQEAYDDIVAMVQPLVAELKKAKQGDMLLHLALAYCHQRDFVKARETAKAAKKAGCKDAKILESALKYYI
ncbi:MAG: hypothetical protein JXQ27_15735 [Acidobacteria bacterium]|nr:hypothetical protein [Acidobacteriota bacterium]